MFLESMILSIFIDARSTGAQHISADYLFHRMGGSPGEGFPHQSHLSSPNEMLSTLFKWA